MSLVVNWVAGFCGNVGAGWSLVLYDYSDSVRTCVHEGRNVFFGTGKIMEVGYEC